MRAVFQNARVTFYGSDGQTTTATSPQAVVDETANTVTMLDGTQARANSGVELLCRVLVFDRTTEMLHGTGDVTIIDPKGFRATGSSFDSDLSLTHMHMK